MLVYRCAGPDGSQTFYTTLMQYAIMPAPATVGLTIAVVFVPLLGVTDATAIAAYATAEFTCTGPYNNFPPQWLLDGKGALTAGECHNSTLTETGDGNATATLIILNNDSTCDAFNISCRIFIWQSHFLYLHNTTLEMDAQLPSPETVRQVNSSTIEWNPPYSSVNTDIIHVDPHITHYTVYGTDIYTGNIIFKKNVTGTQFTSNTRGDDLCLMYQVSAWNAGGEGEKSQPVQESTTQVPRTVSARSITAEVTVGFRVLHIHIDNVDVVCANRIPEFFFITLMNSTGSFFNETTRQHQPGQAVADFAISLPQIFAVVGVVVIVVTVVIVVPAVVITCFKKCRSYKKRNSKGQSNYDNSKSCSTSRPVLLPVNDVVVSAASQQITPVARDPENTAVWIDSAPSTGSSTESGHSDDHE